MRNWIKAFKNLIIPASFVFLIVAPVFAIPMGRAVRAPEPPELISPTSDVIDLKGKDALEFKWLIRNPVFIDYTDLRLYKTYNTYADNLIFKTRIPSGATNAYSIKAGTFQSGQVYTCVLKTVSLGGEKSDFVYTSFKVIK